MPKWAHLILLCSPVSAQDDVGARHKLKFAMDRSRSPAFTRKTIPTTQLNAWAAEGQISACREELLELVSRSLPQTDKKARSWHALCLKRDIKALRREEPSLGISGLPIELGTIRTFNSVLHDALAKLDSRMTNLSSGIPLSRLYGAWEGGIPAAEVPKQIEKEVLPRAVAAFNVCGACGHEGGIEGHDRRIMSICATLHFKGIVLAFLCEPRLAQGMIWPSWTGFKYRGERSSEPNTIAALILEEAQGEIIIVEGVGDERSIWVELPMGRTPCQNKSSTRSQTQGTLVLGVYGPHAGYAASIRRAFWRKRMQEAIELRKRTRYQGWGVLVLGDYNLHFSTILEANQRYEGPLEREVFAALQDPECFGCGMLNGKGVATHRSGTAVDVAMASVNARAVLNVGVIGGEGLRTDHALLTVSMQGLIEMTAAPTVGRARWRADGDWEVALDDIKACLQFVAGWAGSAMRSSELRELAAKGGQRKARQSILDRAVWWRAVLYTVCGHLTGLVVASGPKSSRRHENKVDSIWSELRAMEIGAAVRTPDESDLAREEIGSGRVAKSQEKRVDRYYELLAKSRGDGDAYLSGVIKPKAPIQVALGTNESGKKYGPRDTLDLLTQDILDRGDSAGEGDKSFNRTVEKEVKAARAEAQNDTRREGEEPFDVDLVRKILSDIKKPKSSMHLPRGATGAGQQVGHLVTWALINLAGVLGLVATLWEREISPLRKGGPAVVSDVAQLRPVGYLDDLATVFDAAWLAVTRARLEEYSGSAQAGGKYDAVLMAIGVLMTLQVRRNKKLPTLLQKADLQYGFDLAWRDAVRLHLRYAGVRGRLWLVADAALGKDRLRVRLGPLIGHVATLLDFGIGQGRRSAVHQFGALIRALINVVHEAAVGVGIDVPPPVVRILQDRNAQHGETTVNEIKWSDLKQAVSNVEAQGSDANWDHAISQLDGQAERVTFADIVAKNRFLMMQFVDDTFVLQSSAAGLRGVNKAMENFAYQWRHCFKCGSKRPAVMALDYPGLQEECLGVIAGGHPVLVDKVPVLGVWMDQSLSLQPQLDQVRNRLITKSKELVSSLADLGFGLPTIVGQFSSRVEASALHGAEILASYGGGWRCVAQRLNEANYQVAKLLLGLPQGASLGAGGQVRIFSETRFLTRMGSKFVQRTILARARLQCLPTNSPVYSILRGASNVTGSTWMDDVKDMAQDYGIVPGSAQEFNAFSALSEDQRRNPEVRRRAVKRWKHQIVMPRIWRKEEIWFREQLASLAVEGHLPLMHVLPIRQPFPCCVRWAHWGKTMWRFYRARSIARVSGAVPLVCWGNSSNPKMIDTCPLCRRREVSLNHVLGECIGTDQYRDGVVSNLVGEDWHKWALSDIDDGAEMCERVRFFGLCCSTVAHSLKEVAPHTL